MALRCRVELTVSPDDLAGATGANGLARLTFKTPPKEKKEHPSLIVARRGKDLAILPLNYSRYSTVPVTITHGAAMMLKPRSVGMSSMTAIFTVPAKK